jgi:hypothetical protein
MFLRVKIFVRVLGIVAFCGSHPNHGFSGFSGD